MPHGPARDARRLAAHPQRRAAERAAGGPARRRPPRALRRRRAGQPARRARLGRPGARRAGRRDPAGAGRRAARPDRRRRPPTTCPPRCPSCPADVLDRGGRAAHRPAPCCGATTCCAPPTRCAAPSGTRPGWAGGPPSCACSCPADLRRGPRRAGPRRARRPGAAGRRAAGRPPARRPGRRRPHPRPPAPAARAAGPHRRAQRGAAAGDRPAPARRPPLRPAAAAPRARGRPRTSRARWTGGRPARRWRASAGSASCSPSWRRSRPGCCAAAGVGVRDQKRLARVLHIGEPEAAWLLELAYAAGLLDVGGPHRDEWLPTRGYDIWREQDLPDRWAALAAGWLAGVRLPSLVGQRDVAGKAVNPLSPDLVRHTAPAIRRSALTVLAEFPPGSGLAARRPGRAAALAHPAAGRPAGAGARPCSPRPRGWASSSAGCCPPAGRGLLAAGEDGAADGMRGLLPEPVDHVLAQPDLSLIAPGPAGRRAGRHPRRRRRRRVLRRRDGLPGLGGQRPAGAGRRLVGHRPARLLRPRLAHAGAAGAGLPDRRRRPPARPAAGRGDRVLRPLRRPRAALPGAQRPADRRRRAAPAGARACWSAAWAPTRCSRCCATAGYAPAGENPGGAVLTRPPARPRAAGRRTGAEHSPGARGR